MNLQERLPSSILGGDPFNMFRFLYRQELLWKLFDEDYCLSVMRSCYEGGGKAFDLSFEENTRLFRRLLDETGDDLTGFGNPSWEQGVIMGGKYIQYSRDRILRTGVERLFPREYARMIEEKLAKEAVLVFGYDREAELLSDEEIADVYLDRDLFGKRLNLFNDCQYIMLGGADADYLVTIGRSDILHDMTAVVRERGFLPLCLTQYPTLVVPILEDAGCNVDGYVVPLNKEWSWFDRDTCVDIIRAVNKPFVAFMAFQGANLRKDIRGALDWLYSYVGVESILFGTATPGHIFCFSFCQ